MITVHTRHRTGVEEEKMFKTDLGAWQYVKAEIMDHTNVPGTIATDIANLLCDTRMRIVQKRMGPLFFTISRTGRR